MSSRDNHQTTPHQPLLSSLIVRPSAADYEPGEVRREPRSRPDRGYKLRAGSSSPARRRDTGRYNSDLNHLRSREVGGQRSSGRHRARERGRSRSFGRGDSGPDIGRGPSGPDLGLRSLRSEGMSRNNPNVRPREGDWYCPDPLCGNLNFARREHCNNCKKRYHPAIGGSPRKRYLGLPPLDTVPRRLPDPPNLDRSPGRPMNGFRSPPRALLRDGPREFGIGTLPPIRHDDLRFSDLHLRRDRLDFPDDLYRGRARFERPISPIDWAHRDRGRDSLFGDRQLFERRPLSPLPLVPLPLPLPPPNLPYIRDRWGRDFRERSRSPLRGRPPPKDYRRDAYQDRGRDDRRGMGRDRIGRAY